MNFEIFKIYKFLLRIKNNYYVIFIILFFNYSKIIYFNFKLFFLNIIIKK